MLLKDHLTKIDNLIDETIKIKNLFQTWKIFQKNIKKCNTKLLILIY